MKRHITLFNQLAQDMILLNERKALFLSLGVDPADWPESKAKKAAMAFLKLEEAKGSDHARFKTLPMVEDLEGCELPADSGELKAAYQEALGYSHAIVLAERIRREPLRAEEFIRQHQIRRSKEIGSFELNDAVNDWLDDLQRRIESKEALVEIPNWVKLSRMIGGFNPGRFSMIAAGTGAGKTLLTLNLAFEASRRIDVLYFNMEMSWQDIVTRCVAAGTNLNFSQIVRGELDFERLGKYVETLKTRHRIEITDGRALTLDQIQAKSYLAKAQRPELGLIFVDYDQKIRFPGNEDEEWRALQRAAEALEEVAKQLNVHICLLAQADDNGDPKASKRSKQPAATVLHFYKDAYGDHVIEAIKNRFGKQGEKLFVKFDGARSLIEELSHETPRGRKLII